MRLTHAVLASLAALTLSLPARPAGPPALPPDLATQSANTWVKRTPLAAGPVSPRMGYEATVGYDARAKLLIRWGGHNQGGGGEQRGNDQRAHRHSLVRAGGGGVLGLNAQRSATMQRQHSGRRALQM